MNDFRVTALLTARKKLLIGVIMLIVDRNLLEANVAQEGNMIVIISLMV